VRTETEPGGNPMLVPASPVDGPMARRSWRPMKPRLATLGVPKSPQTVRALLDRQLPHFGRREEGDGGTTVFGHKERGVFPTRVLGTTSVQLSERKNGLLTPKRPSGNMARCNSYFWVMPTFFQCIAHLPVNRQPLGTQR
jgi:hypothetical protein